MSTSAEKMESGVTGARWPASLTYWVMKVPVKICTAPEHMSFSIHVCIHICTSVPPHIYLYTYTQNKVAKKHTQTPTDLPASLPLPHQPSPATSVTTEATSFTCTQLVGESQVLLTLIGRRAPSNLTAASKSSPEASLTQQAPCVLIGRREIPGATGPTSTYWRKRWVNSSVRICSIT